MLNAHQTLSVSLPLGRGWRPTTAFHVVHSERGLQTTTSSSRAKRGSLCGLSSDQIFRLGELQQITRDIDGKMAKQQEKVADIGILNHNASSMIRVLKKEEGLRGILKSADELRMRTLAGVVDILSPIQAVHFLMPLLS